MVTHTKFAFASSPSPEEARFVIFGVPFEATVSYNTGTRFAPGHIRKASWNLEEFILDLGMSIPADMIYDAGDIPMVHLHEDLDIEIQGIFQNISGAIPIMLGGEHSITPLAVKNITKKHSGLKYLVIDAHLDYRKEYLGLSMSHACSTRRVAEIVGPENVMVIGARSADEDEFFDFHSQGCNLISARDMERAPMDRVIGRIKDFISNLPVYLSIDIDGIDPSFAPGTGTPEPYGIQPRMVRDIIESIYTSVVAMDIVEISPQSDCGDATAMIAAELIRRFITLRSGDFAEDR